MTVIQLLPESLRGAIRWRAAIGFRRAAVVLAAVGLTAGAAALTAPIALAVTGSEPGHMSLNPAGGATSLTPTWSTTDRCPASFQTSAVLYALNTDGSIGSRISPAVSSVTAAFSGKLLGTVSQLLALGTNVRRGGTSEWVVACFAGPGGTGARKYVQDLDVILAANGSSYTTSSASGQPASLGQAGGTSATSPAAEAAWIVGAIALAGLLGTVAWRWRRHRLLQRP